MIRRILLIGLFCAFCFGQQQSTSTGVSTSTGGAIQSAPFGTHHVVTPTETPVVTDFVTALKRGAAAVGAAFSTIDSVVLRKFHLIAALETIGAADSVNLLHKIKQTPTDSVAAAATVTTSHLAVFRPTTSVDTGQNQNGVAAFCTNPTFAYDANVATATTCLGDWNSVNGNFTYRQITYSGFPANPGGFTSIVLNVVSAGQVDSSCTAPATGMSYSLNGGSSYIDIILAQNSYAQRTDQISLPLAQDFSLVRVRGTGECAGGTGTPSRTTESIYETWIQAQ